MILRAWRYSLSSFFVVHKLGYLYTELKEYEKALYDKLLEEASEVINTNKKEEEHQMPLPQSELSPIQNCPIHT